MSIAKPQVLVFQQFTSVPSELTNPLRGFILGPEYSLNRYGVSGEGGHLIVGHTFDANTTLNWADLDGARIGGVTDQSYTRVFLDNAEVEYYDDPDPDTIFTIATGNRNRFDSTLVLAGDNVNALWADRDVQVGDIVHIDIDGATEHTAKITNMIASSTAAAVTSVSENAEGEAGHSADVVSASPVVDITNATGGTLESSDVSSSYTGLASGRLVEVYTITCVQSGATDVDYDNMRFDITSADGEDVYYNVAPSSGVLTVTSARGTVTIDLTSGGTGVQIVYGEFILLTLTDAWTRTNPVRSSAGTAYNGTSDTRFLIEVVQGADISVEAATVRVRSQDGAYDSGLVAVGNGALTVAAGNSGIEVTFTLTDELLTGEYWYVDATAAGTGDITAFELDSEVPGALTSFNRMTFHYEADGIELFPAHTSGAVDNFTQDEDGITIENTAAVHNTEIRTAALPIRKADVTIQYRQLITNRGGIKAIGSIEDLTTIYDTPVDPDNPLVYALSKALANSGSGVSVSTGLRAYAVTSDDAAGYTTGLAIAENRTDVYTIVPLTFDRTIQNLVAAHVNAQSTPEVGQWRVALFSHATHENFLLFTDEDGANSSGAGNREISFTETFSTTPGDANAPRAGDILRTNFTPSLNGVETYSEYVISQIVDSNTIEVSTDLDAAISTAKAQIFRPFNAEDAVDQYILNKGFADRRIYNIFPGVLPSGGVDVYGYHLAAAIAGMIGAVVPQQGLTNITISGFDNAENVLDVFSRTQLDRLASAGTWIVTQDQDTGSVFTRHQLSTDPTDLNTRELSATKNVDSVSYVFQNRLRRYIGRANVTDSALQVIRTDVNGTISFLQSIRDPLLGGQLGPDSAIAEFRRHTVLRDRIVIVLLGDFPAPLNNIELTLVV